VFASRLRCNVSLALTIIHLAPSEKHSFIAMSKIIEFPLSGEFITLDALLKTTGLAASGGEAKAMVAAGHVQVDGQPELRKRCKIRVGQVVTMGERSIRVIGR
jgi:ribosome-associated protein